MSIPEELSDREQQVLDFVRGYWRENQFSPSIREIGAHIGIDSTSLVQFYLDKLQEAGKIRRNKSIARSIVVIQ